VLCIDFVGTAGAWTFSKHYSVGQSKHSVSACALVAPYKKKHRKYKSIYGVEMVAWDGIEPSTRGFSTHLSKLRTVLFQALTAF
jgi:hypothetical protein